MDYGLGLRVCVVKFRVEAVHIDSGFSTLC